MGIHHLTAPGWQGEGEYRFAFYEGQVYGLENTLISLFFLLVVVSMIKKILFGSKMKAHLSRESFGRIMQYQRPIMQSSASRLPETNEDELDEERSSDSNDPYNRGSWKKIKEFSFCQRVFNLFINILLWSFGASTTYLFALTTGFGYVEPISSVLCCFMLFVLIIYFNSRAGVTSPIILTFLSILGLASSIIPTIFFSDICICHNSDSGYLVNEGQYLSTAFTRASQLRKVCPENELCHLYVTLPEDTSRQFILNVHTGIEIKEIRIILTDLETMNIVSDRLIEMSLEQILLEINGNRNTFSVVYQDLLPYKLYSIEVSNAETHVVLRVSKYRTLPSQEQININGQQVHLAFGGDWGISTKYALSLNKRLVESNPDVLVFGGNVAQDNGMKTCYHTWDVFLSNFESQIFEPLDRIIPFIIAVGNKDVGMNSMKNYNISISADQGPLLFAWFPQTLDANGDLTLISQRRTFHSHIIGNIALLALDSGYVMNYEGYQKEWLETRSQELSQKGYYLFAVYHYPIYPACIQEHSKWDTSQSSKIGEQHWTTIFDKYRFVGSFENHQKLFKRTHPIRARQLNENGTVYFGDGTWGQESGGCDAPSQFPSIFAKMSTAENLQHFWLATISKDTAKYDAYSKDTSFLDKNYIQNLNLYTAVNQNETEATDETNLIQDQSNQRNKDSTTI